jgi:hypothetical protein
LVSVDRRTSRLSHLCRDIGASRHTARPPRGPRSLSSRADFGVQRLTEVERDGTVFRLGLTPASAALPAPVGPASVARDQQGTREWRQTAR